MELVVASCFVGVRPATTVHDWAISA